jgi:hypothetical protein
MEVSLVIVLLHVRSITVRKGDSQICHPHLSQSDSFDFILCKAILRSVVELGPGKKRG